jgi:hypothetical protein
MPLLPLWAVRPVQSLNACTRVTFIFTLPWRKIFEFSWQCKRVHPRTGHGGPEREYRYSSSLSLTSALDGVGGHRHAPAAIYPQERPGIHCKGGWLGPRAGLDRCGKCRPHRDSIPGPSSPYFLAVCFCNWGFCDKTPRDMVTVRQESEQHIATKDGCTNSTDNTYQNKYRRTSLKITT